MPDYCFVMGNGEIITASYDRSDALSQDQVYTEVKNAFTSLGNDQVEIKSVSDDLREVYQVTIPRPAQHEKETVYVCAKGTTPGGRDNLKNEQRIQQKARFLNLPWEDTELAINELGTMIADLQQQGNYAVEKWTK